MSEVKYILLVFVVPFLVGVKALLILYLIYGGSYNRENVTVKEPPVSDIETCKVAGELISKDLEFKVREVSYRCVNAWYNNGGPYITGVAE